MRVETKLLSENDKIMHFITEEKLNIKGAVEFDDARSIRKSPLAERVFDIGGIEKILITSDGISVTKLEKAEWEELKPQILAEIIDYIASGEEIITNIDDSIDDVIKNIKGLIDARIRPAVQKDGGDIAFRGFENGVVYVELLGKCVGCPYTQVTLKEGIEKVLKTYIDEVVSVEKYES